METNTKTTLKNKDQKKPDYVKIIKIVILSFLFVLAHIFFGLILKRAFEQYELLLFPNLGFLGLMTLIFLMMFIIALIGGLFVALVRPFWVGLVVFFVSTLFTIIFFNISLWSILFGLIYFVLGLIYISFIEHELKIRICFSVHPIWEGQKILLAGLIMLVSFAFAYGYYSEAKQYNFAIPIKYKEMILKGITDAGNNMGSIIGNQMQGVLENQVQNQAGQLGENQPSSEKIKKQTEDQVTEGIEMLNPLSGADKEIDKFWQNLESSLKPFVGLIAFGLGFLTFLTLETFAFFVFWLVPVILLAVFPLLKLLKIAKVSTTMEEVKRLIL